MNCGAGVCPTSSLTRSMSVCAKPACCWQGQGQVLEWS